MKFSGIETNENLRFLKCPVCGNEEFSQEAGFCRICGSAAYNYCLDHYDDNGYRIGTGCGKPNPGNARYCEHCGNPTLLFKYLNQWENGSHHLEKHTDTKTDNPVSAKISENKNKSPLAQSKNNTTADLDSAEEVAASSLDDLTNAFD